MSRPGARVADALGAVRERIAAAERALRPRAGERHPRRGRQDQTREPHPRGMGGGSAPVRGELRPGGGGEARRALPALRPRGGIEWHFVGALQANKSRTVAERFDWVHTVDRVRIARRLSDQRPAFLPPLNVCLQVNVSEESSKSGVRVEEAARSRGGGGRASPVASARPDGDSPAVHGLRRAAGCAPAAGRGVRTPTGRRSRPRHALDGHDRRPRGGGGRGHHHGPDRHRRVRTAGLARIFHRCPAYTEKSKIFPWDSLMWKPLRGFHFTDANLLVVAGRTPSSRFDSAQALVSATPSASFSPCGPPQRHLGAQTRKTRRVFRVSHHLEEFPEFFEYATNIGEICAPARRLNPSAPAPRIARRLCRAPPNLR